MSSNLGWIPSKEPKYKYLDTDIKFALRKRYGEPVQEIINESQLDYLRGLKDAGIKDAIKLIDAIEKYGEIEIKEVY